MKNEKGVAYIIVLLVLSILAFVVQLFADQILYNTKSQKKNNTYSMQSDLVNNTLMRVFFEFMFAPVGQKFNTWVALGANCYALDGFGVVRIKSGTINGGQPDPRINIAISSTLNALEYHVDFICNGQGAYDSVTVKSFILEAPE